MSQLDWWRGWLSMMLLALCLVLLIAPQILAASIRSTQAEMSLLLPPQATATAIAQAEAWRGQLWQSGLSSTGSPESLGALLQHVQQWLDLVALRAALLWYVLPWFLIIGVVAVLDGWIARRIHQASFRPSNALLHRMALITLKAALMGLLSYGLLPVPWPVSVLPCLLFVTLVALKFLLAETQKRL